MDRGFCSICGSSILMLIWGCPELSVLSSDMLDDQSIYEPRKNILSGPQCGTIGRWMTFEKSNEESKEIKNAQGL